MTMVRIACPCGRFFFYFLFPEALEQLRPHEISLFGWHEGVTCLAERSQHLSEPKEFSNST